MRIYRRYALRSKLRIAAHQPFSAAIKVSAVGLQKLRRRRSAASSPRAACGGFPVRETFCRRISAIKKHTPGAIPVRLLGKKTRRRKFFSASCYNFKFYACCSSSIMVLPMRTPITDAIIRPLVQPLESPKQWRPFTLVLNFSSILTLLE